MIEQIKPTAAVREEVIARLKQAVTDGDIPFDEFERRVAAAHATESQESLVSLVPALSQPVRTSQSRSLHRRALVVAGIAAVAAVALVSATVLVSSPSPRSHGTQPAPPVIKSPPLAVTVSPPGVYAAYGPADSCGAFGTATEVGGQNCYLVLTFTNTGSSPITFEPADLRMVDLHGDTYSTSPVIPSCYDTVEINDPSTLPPKSQLTVQLCYAVMTGALPQRLVGSFSLNGLNVPVAPSTVRSEWQGA